MIKTKKDLNYYREQDKINLGKKNSKFSYIKELLFPGSIYRFQVVLRKAEYYNNKTEKWFGTKILSVYYKILLRKKSIRLGFSIPLNVFGPGLSIAHYGTIVVNSAVKVGANCRLHVCVNIGASSGSKKAPQIGDNVYIAPGCKIFGDINIADNVTISANSVVNKSITTPNVVIGGVPAKLLKQFDTDEKFSWILK
jgi:serine O-acetyltransferase